MAESSFFTANASNTKASNSWGFWNNGAGLNLNYNGVDVVYFPKSFAERGFHTGDIGGYTYPQSGYGYSTGNAVWFANGNFLNQASWDFLKPMQLESDLVDQLKKSTYDPKNNITQWNGKTYQSAFDMADVPDFQDGYIIEKSKWDEISRQTNPSGDTRLFSWSPPRLPSGLGTTPDGNLSYVGYSQGGGGSDKRSDLFYINNSQPNGYHQYQWYDCGWFGCGFDNFMGSTLGQLITLGARIISPAFNLGYTLGNYAFNDGKIGDVALALISANTPGASGTTAAQGTFFEIPQIASATSKIADFYTTQLGLSTTQAAAAAKVTFDTGLGYLANGQDFTKAFTNAAAGYVGAQAGAEVAKMVSGLGPDLQKITFATTSAATKATLLNQDVGQAVTTAFAQTAIPIAVDGAIKASGATLPKAARDAIVQTAVASALNPNADIEKILAGAVTGALVDAAYQGISKELVDSGIIKSTDSEAANKIKSVLGEIMAGRDPKDAITAALLKTIAEEAKDQLKDWTAQKEGWASYDEKKKYQEQFGKDVKPDLALVKQLDPDFDLEAYKKLNNIATNAEAIEDYLSSGMVQGKTTNFEDYVTRVLSAVPEFDRDFYAEEFAAALQAAKTSSNPQQAVQTIANQINQSYTTTEEATQFFRDTFGRPPESESDLAFIQRYTGIPEVQAKEVLQTSKSTVDQSNQRRLETLAKARDSLENILRSEGYGDDDIALLYDAGVYDQLVDGLIQQQEQNIQQLQSRANAMASTFGSDSTEAKAAVRDLLQAQYDVGGYGVTKDGDNFVVAASTQGGALNHPGLIVYPDGSVVDLSQRGVDIDGVLTYDDGTTYSFGDAGDRAIVAALAIGESPNPPSDGGRSLFGTGTGSGEGPAFGFSFVGIDQKTGGSVYDSEDSGFSLIAYSDGKALAVNKLDPTQVIWVNPEVAKEVIDSKPVKTPEQIKKEFEEAERAKAAESVFTPGEVEKMLKDAGFKDPTEQQVGQFVGVSADPSKTKEAINKYIFDNTVSADEARQILESIGIQNPSQKDIERLTGQYPKSELEQKALEIKPDAQYNALVDAINRLQNQPVEELESSLRRAIADAQQGGLEGDAALRAAIDAVSNNLGTTRSELLARMGTTEAALRSDMASGLAGVSAETQAKYNALTAEQKALADALAKQGVDLNAAIKTAQEQAQQQITDVERSILDRVAAYEAAGMARDEALNLALGEVSSQLGTTRDALLSSIGETEQRLTDQIAGVSQDVQAKYEALSAEQKALADALVQQGVNINSAIEAASKQAAEALAGTEQRLAGQINTVAELLGKPARQVTQSDIDYVNQMIGGGTGADLAYDINRDGKVDQADLDFMQGLIDGGGSGWTGQVGTVWGPTGLYGQQAQEAEATRQAQARASAAARRLQLQKEMRQGLAAIQQQAPQAIQQSYRKIDPIYAQTRYANLNAPLFQSNLWGEQPVAQTPTNQPNQFRMASGGYLDTQGDPQTWDDIYHMLK